MTDRYDRSVGLRNPGESPLDMIELTPEERAGLRALYDVVREGAAAKALGVSRTAYLRALALPVQRSTAEAIRRHLPSALAVLAKVAR